MKAYTCQNCNSTFHSASSLQPESCPFCSARNCFLRSELWTSEININVTAVVSAADVSSAKHKIISALSAHIRQLSAITNIDDIRINWIGQL